MKKIMVLILLVFVVLGLYGCAQKAATNEGTGTTAPTNVTQGTAADNAEISNDIDSISKEIASISTDDTGDVITPISADDITD